MSAWQSIGRRRIRQAGIVGLVVVLASAVAQAARADNPGLALQVDGVNDQIILPETRTILGQDWESSKTVSLWIKPTGAAVICAYNSVGFCDNVIGDRPRWWGISLGVINGQDRIWVWNYDGSPGTPYEVIGVPYTAGEWVHISLVHGDGVLRAFRNGVPAGFAPSGATLQPNTGARPRLHLGGIINNASRNWTMQGALDEVSLWNIPRSAEQIQAGMYRTLSGSEPGLRAYYAMSDGSGLILSDDSVNDWSGTLSDGGAGVPPNGSPPQWILSDAFGPSTGTPTPSPTISATTTPDTTLTPVGTPTEMDTPTEAWTATPSATPSWTPGPSATPTQAATATAQPSTTPLPPTMTPSGDFPATGGLDDFNRANGGLGGDWSGNTGAFAVADDQLDVNSNGAILWKQMAFGVEQEVFIRLAYLDPNAGSVSLLLKSQSSTSANSGVIRVLFNRSAQLVQVWTYAGAQGWVQRGGDLAAPLSTGDQFGARVDSAGQIWVYRNGQLLGTRSIGTWPHGSMGGFIGLWLANASSSFLDDFGGGSTGGVAPAIPQPTGTPTPTLMATLTASPTATASPTSEPWTPTPMFTSTPTPLMTGSPDTGDAPSGSESGSAGTETQTAPAITAGD